MSGLFSFCKTIARLSIRTLICRQYPIKLMFLSLRVVIRVVMLQHAGVPPLREALWYLRRDVGVLDHLGPFADFGGEKFLELLRRAAHRLGAVAR